MTNTDEQAQGLSNTQGEQAREQLQFLLDQLGQLGNSAIQVRVPDGTQQENLAAEKFVEGCIVLLRRFGAGIAQAVEDTRVLDHLEDQITNNPAVDLIVPDAVIESTLAVDEQAPLRMLVEHLVAWHEAHPQAAQ